MPPGTSGVHCAYLFPDLSRAAQPKRNETRSHAACGSAFPLRRLISGKPSSSSSSTAAHFSSSAPQVSCFLLLFPCAAHAWNGRERGDGRYLPPTAAAGGTMTIVLLSPLASPETSVPEPDPRRVALGKFALLEVTTEKQIRVWPQRMFLCHQNSVHFGWRICAVSGGDGAEAEILKTHRRSVDRPWRWEMGL